MTQDFSATAHLYCQSFPALHCRITSQLTFPPGTLLPPLQVTDPTSQLPEDPHPVLISTPKGKNVESVLAHKASHCDWRVNIRSLQAFKPRSGPFLKATLVFSHGGTAGQRSVACISRTTPIHLLEPWVFPEDTTIEELRISKLSFKFHYLPAYDKVLNSTSWVRKSPFLSFWIISWYKSLFRYLSRLEG